MYLFSPRLWGARSSQRAPWKDPTEGVLSAEAFELFLERERSLADRGTRLFSLLILRRKRGDREDLERLSRQLRVRLRSTDLVGRLDADRLGVLLTDTEPAGARVVAGWVEQAVGHLEIRLEPSIYVYPSISDATDRANKDQDDGPDGNGHSNGGGNGKVTRRIDSRAHGYASALENGRSPVNGHADHAPVGASAGAVDGLSDAHWPMKDLWPELSAPLPLWKRSLDILLSAVALLALFPLFVLVAIAIRLDSPGPVIFRQMRAGRGGRPFVFYKFRSMFVDAEQRRAELEARNEQGGPVFKIRKDPRITRVGRLLRRYSVDELPQIWNVLKGDISLVGPRSPTLNELPEYERWQRRRLNVTGGITCIWQVSGRNEIAFPDWMRMDRRYAAQRSFWLDLRLLARTFSAVVSGRGAY
jgi:lipopolysaccharide/colanic/teichoic acid biosynthesis glycosyltransferase